MQLPTPHFTAERRHLDFDIRHDIDDIDDLDEFLEDDVEDCLQAMLGNAGCFY